MSTFAFVINQQFLNYGPWRPGCLEKAGYSDEATASCSLGGGFGSTVVSCCLLQAQGDRLEVWGTTAAKCAARPGTPRASFGEVAMLLCWCSRQLWGTGVRMGAWCGAQSKPLETKPAASREVAGFAEHSLQQLMSNCSDIFSGASLPSAAGRKELGEMETSGSLHQKKKKKGFSEICLFLGGGQDGPHMRGRSSDDMVGSILPLVILRYTGFWRSSCSLLFSR